MSQQFLFLQKDFYFLLSYISLVLSAHKKRATWFPNTLEKVDISIVDASKAVNPTMKQTRK